MESESVESAPFLLPAESSLRLGEPGSVRRRRLDAPSMSLPSQEWCLTRPHERRRAIAHGRTSFVVVRFTLGKKHELELSILFESRWRSDPRSTSLMHSP